MASSAFIRGCLLWMALFAPSIALDAQQVMSAPVSLDLAGIAIQVLQGWYNTTTGLWDGAGWWNSANALTVLADYSALPSKDLSYFNNISENTYFAAQNTRFKAYYKVQDSMGLTDTISKPHHDVAHTGIHPRAFQGFINDYYDDEGWWALAWIKAYDLTKNDLYLGTAISLFEDMAAGWDQSTCGGVWWDKKYSSINAIENELFISVGAHLATRSSENRDSFLKWALKAWTWFQGTNMENIRGSIADGIDLRTCQANHKDVWSYNQGVILGGLVELSKATLNTSYIDAAIYIANAAINRMCDANGVLHDVCEPYNCGLDGSQFKGIFLRNLQILNQAAPRQQYYETIVKNAASIWEYDRGSDNRIGLVWSGPYNDDGNAVTQTSGVDALIAAASLGFISNATATS